MTHLKNLILFSLSTFFHSAAFVPDSLNDSGGITEKARFLIKSENKNCSSSSFSVRSLFGKRLASRDIRISFYCFSHQETKTSLEFFFERNRIIVAGRETRTGLLFYEWKF